MATQRKRPARSRSPDISLCARVDAKEMRFVEVPETKVEFFGGPGRESAHGSDPTNLPHEVREGESYRNVRVDYRLGSRILFDEEGR